MNSPYSPRKEKEKKEKIKKKRKKEKEEEKNKGEMRKKKKKKKKRKSFVCAPVFEKSILCDLVKTYLLIPLFTN